MFETVIVTLFFVLATIIAIALVRAFVLITINQIKEAAFNEATEIQYRKMCDAGIPVRIRTDVLTGRKFTDIVPTYCDLELSDYDRVNKYGTHALHQFFDLNDCEIEIGEDKCSSSVNNVGFSHLHLDVVSEPSREERYHTSNAWGR